MNVFITGGTSGIGLGLAQYYIKLGYKVAVASFQKREELTTLPKELFYYQADVTKEEDVKKAVDQYVLDHGRIDLMVANAGLNMPKTPIPDLAKGKSLTMVNVLGVVHAFNAALPHFIQQKSGHFAALSSLSGLNGLPGMSYYGASKAFVGSFCESLAIDLRDYNIFVTCVYPGFIATDFTKNNTHPMPFLLSPEKAVQKIANAIHDRKEVAYFPIIPALFMGLLRRLPRSLYFWIMRKDILKLRQH
jgi:short-subunit dehydrogenase